MREQERIGEDTREREIEREKEREREKGRERERERENEREGYRARAGMPSVSLVRPSLSFWYSLNSDITSSYECASIISSFACAFQTKAKNN